MKIQPSPAAGFPGRQLLLPGVLSVLGALALAHESPVDHVEREFRVWVEAGRLHLTCRVQHSERSVLMQLHQMDTNTDGTISDAERDSFFTGEAGKLASLFKLDLDGQSLKLAPARDRAA